VTGSAILGFVLVLLVEQFPKGRLARPIVGTGVIGAYTTFSTFEVDAVTLIRAGHPVTAGVYLVASVAIGLIAVWLGITAARSLLQVEQWLQEEM
jgi:CrcB protein